MQTEHRMLNLVKFDKSLTDSVELNSFAAPN